MASNLDEEIEDLRARVTTLKKQLRVHASTLITAPSTRQLLSSAPQPDKPTTTLTLPTHSNQTRSQTEAQAHQKNLLADALAQQQAHAQQCLYRTCATLTTFRARDPDPRAVDGGAILGLRIEVVSRARFLRPYYVLLNRPFPSSRHHLRVHRHTLPPCIPMAGLAVRYLAPPPTPTPSGSGGEQRRVEEKKKQRSRQDLAKFARALRREVVRYHHRLGVVADLRNAAGIGRAGYGDQEEEEGEKGDSEGRPSNRLVDISPADAEAKHLSIEWADGRTGRLVMGDDGEIVKLVVLGENGRDYEAARGLLGGAVRIEDVVKRLAALR
ncbi:Cenp-O kinetochore centromere component-domain-containing protein [Corynascus novoguineensis]|uniref:Cenp-O kinetochore centromere component-domain-containing protein n=1 Tax=Corynascus novoguineensis TaxID=1126955 RepID=A0AAN7CV42_9PEZI|nr:Cenp-O kinetochore centromere component-domain-containing protein [Corynascus novoguineensis]